MPGQVRQRVQQAAFSVAPPAAINMLRGEPVLMWHHGRCGSTVLARMLGQHPRIHWTGEIFRDLHLKSDVPETAFDDRMKRMRSSTLRRIPGFEVQGLSCQDPFSVGLDVEEMLDRIASYGVRKAIILRRRNLLRYFVSVRLVVESDIKRWHCAAADRERAAPVQVMMPIEEHGLFGTKRAPLVDLIDYMESEIAATSAQLARRFDCLSLTYEDDIENDPTAAYRKVLDAMELPETPVRVTLKRTNTRPISDVVKNIEDLRAALRGSRAEWMLSQ